MDQTSVPHLRLNALELLRVPGASKALLVNVDAHDIGIDDERITGLIEVALTATSSIDGIVVRGTITSPWATSCRRCLGSASGHVLVDVEEVYQQNATTTEAFEIVGDQIDLTTAVREYVMIDLPDGPLCRPDCLGICATCGCDRNTEGCTCSTEILDIRWAALENIRFDASGDGEP